MQADLLQLLACPVCKGPLEHHGAELVCRACAKAWPIEDEIPVLLVEAARPWTAAPGADAGA